MIALWGSAGFLVAGFWVLFAFATFPSTNEGPLGSRELNLPDCDSRQALPLSGTRSQGGEQTHRNVAGQNGSKRAS